MNYGQMKIEALKLNEHPEYLSIEDSLSQQFFYMLLIKPVLMVFSG